MEKDFNKEYPSSNEDPFEDIENQDFYSDYQLELVAKRNDLLDEIENLKEKLDESSKTISYLNDFAFNFEMSEFCTSASECSVPPVTSHIQESQDVFEDEYENLPNPTVLAESLEQSNVVSSNTDALERRVAQMLPVQSNVISNKLQCFEAMLGEQIKQCLSENSPPKTLHDETQVDGSCTETQFKIPPHSEFTEKSAASCRSYNCKGKEAVNPKYRYKKRSKSDVSCAESPVMNSPIEHAEAFGTTELHPPAKDASVKHPEEAFGTTELHPPAKDASVKHPEEAFGTTELHPPAKDASVKHPEEAFGTTELHPPAKDASVKHPEEAFGTTESSGKKSSVQCSEEAFGTPESSGKKSSVQCSEEAFGTPESSGKKSLVQCSEEAIVTPESKALDSKSPKTEIARISPAVKRKESESRIEDHDNQQLQESCARTSNLYGNRSDGDGNLIIRKKLKFVDDENISRQYPIQTANLSKKNYESIDFAEVLSQDQEEQCHESEQLTVLASSSDLSSEISPTSTDEKSSFASGTEDVLLRERSESSLTNLSDASLNEKDELSLMTVSDSSQSGSSES